MRSNAERYHSIFIANQWALVFLAFASLGLGWYARHIPEENKQIGDFVLDIHTSIGIIVALLLLFQIISKIIFRYPPYPNEFPQWCRRLAYSLYLLIYVSFILTLISGYFQAIFRGAPVEFWGLRMPTWDAVDMPVADLLGRFWGAPFRIWGATDVTSAAFFGTVHGLFAFVLVGLIFAYIVCAAIDRFRQPRPATPMLSLSTQPQRGCRANHPTYHSQRCARIGKKPTPLRLGRILVAGDVCGLYRALTRIRYVGACIQPWRIRVWRCHLLGRRRILTFVVGSLLGILLHARRAQNRFKTGFLFKQKRLDYLLVSACGPYYQPFGNISFVCRSRPQHIIVNCEDRIATPWDSYYRSQ